MNRVVLPTFYKKKNSDSRLKKFFKLSLFPATLIGVFFVVFYFWQWIFAGVGVDPQMIPQLLKSASLSEQKSAVLAWSQLVRNGSKETPALKSSEADLLEKIIASNPNDDEILASASWIYSQLQNREEVESRICLLIKRYKDLTSSSVLTELVQPLQGFVEKLPCLEDLRSILAHEDSRLRLGLAAVMGAGFKKKLEGTRELLILLLKDPVDHVRVQSALALVSNKSHEEESLTILKNYLESIHNKPKLEISEKKFSVKVLDDLSHADSQVKSKLRFWVEQISKFHPDLGLRNQAIGALRNSAKKNE